MEGSRGAWERCGVQNGGAWRLSGYEGAGEGGVEDSTLCWGGTALSQVSSSPAWQNHLGVPALNRRGGLWGTFGVFHHGRAPAARGTPEGPGGVEVRGAVEEAPDRV